MGALGLPTLGIPMVPVVNAVDGLDR